MSKYIGRLDRESAADYLDRLVPLRATDPKTHDRLSKREQKKRSEERWERFSTAPVTLPKLKFLESKE